MNKLFLFILIFFMSCKDSGKANKNDYSKDTVTTNFKEPYRPQFHFSPKAKWMNDPNGLVYHKGTYHLFYQYYPEDIVWGPMHWGHASSKNMLHWEHHEIALFPDDKGYIFSGSAVVDINNSSGFGSTDNPPLVAIFTYHDPEGEQQDRDDFQTQGIAYSLDNGISWTKYAKNPVIRNNGIKDFRDPKVFWHEETKKWILILVAGDHAKIYNSDDLKNWNYLSDFGSDKGAHGGVWECPDLFKLKIGNTDEEKWVLLISINPGAPNGGSGTQYFVGDFDGKQFISDQKEIKWIDYGTDNYAGVTYNNTPDERRLFIGWMSNWNYARDTPTEVWRSAMTLPRELLLTSIEGSYFLMNYPIEGVNELLTTKISEASVLIENERMFEIDNFNQSQIIFVLSHHSSYQLIFSNDVGDKLILEMDADKSLFSIDRSTSGYVDFEDSFGAEKHLMPITHLPKGEAYELKLFLDASSLEIFIGNGQYVMTDQIFPKSNYNKLTIKKIDNTISLNDFQIDTVRSIW